LETEAPNRTGISARYGFVNLTNSKLYLLLEALVPPKNVIANVYAW
jgi:hypothetical protein